MLEQADNRDLKSCALWACGFDPRHSHKKTSAPETASGGRFFGYAPNTFFGEQREESAECRLDSFYYISFADSYFTAAIGAIPEIFFDDIKKDVPGWWEFRTNLGEIREELELDPPLMPPEETIDEVSKILTITGFKDKIEKIRASQEAEK